jgi:hypothetical protein
MNNAKISDAEYRAKLDSMAETLELLNKIQTALNDPYVNENCSRVRCEITDELIQLIDAYQPTTSS